MLCPNCGFETEEDAPDCPRCGIVIERFHARRIQESYQANVGMAAPPVRPRKPSMLLRLLLACLGLFAFLFTLSFAMRDRFPSPYLPLAALENDPIQEKTDKRPFQALVNGIPYSIFPQYTYDLRGMVVSYHTSGGIADIYHWKLWQDYINIKDICVLWGPNLRTHVVQKIDFHSDTWTCFCETDDITAWNRFDKERFSNNHLLSADRNISREVAKVRLWDQVHLTGYLVSYSHNRDGGFERGTSVTRSDTGQGACETVFLTDFKILKRANPGWRTIFTVSACGLLVTLALLSALGLSRLARAYRRLGKPLE